MQDKILYNNLCKSQVAIYIGKSIDIEGIAEVEYCKTIPFPGHNWSKLWDQMDATNDGLGPNDASRSVTILYKSRYLIHAVFGVWCCWDWSEPFDVCKVLWGVAKRVQVEHLQNDAVW